MTDSPPPYPGIVPGYQANGYGPPVGQGGFGSAPPSYPQGGFANAPPAYPQGASGQYPPNQPRSAAGR